MKITIAEELLGQGIIKTTVVDLTSSELTLKEIIAAKVETTVNTINNNLSSVKSNHHFSSDEELRLNREFLDEKNRQMQKRLEALELDAEKETYIALEAFQKGTFFVLIDDKQYSDLEESVLLSDQSQVKFIKLTQLQGG